MSEEGGSDFLEALSEECCVGSFAAGDGDFEFEDDGHDDFLDIGHHHSADFAFFVFEAGEDGAEGDIGFLEGLMLSSEDLVCFAEFTFDVEVHEGAADAFSDNADEGVFFLEEGAVGQDGDSGGVEDLDGARGSAADSDVGGHAPRAFEKPIAEVLPLSMDDSSAGHVGELPCFWEEVDDTLEKGLDGMEVIFAQLGDGVEALEFLDSLAQGVFDLCEGA